MRTDRTCIVGIGATEFSKKSGRSELQLAVEAVRAALDDAGLTPSDVDGLVTYTHDTSPEIEVARTLGTGELTFSGRLHYGGGDCCSTISMASMAVATGVAEVVVVYRAFNERSGERYGRGFEVPSTASADAAQWGWYLPLGLFNAIGWIGVYARRYMHEYGATSEDFGRVTVAARRHAATNPNARFYGRPITLADHQQSRFVVEPLRLLDCCLESDAGVALVVTSAERAADLRQTPVAVRAAAQGTAPRQYLMAGYYDDDPLAFHELRATARALWARAGIGPSDVQVAVLYDHFTPAVFWELEGYGFCGRGDAKDFVAGGGIEIDGQLPVNPHGGLLGEAYVHGINGINEAVRQVRGTAVNQVPDVENVLVAAPPGGPTSGLVLGVA